MPAKLRKPPAYRLHKPSGQAVVRIDGRDYYLGRHGTEPSLEAYRRLIAEWATSPRPHPAATRSIVGVDLTINELVVAYWDKHVVGYYTKNGRPTSEVDNIRQALRFLRRLFGSTPARVFGPPALKVVRQDMVATGRCRSLVNKDINRLRAMFRWSVEHELLPVTIYQALLAVAGLRKGRSEAREAEPIGPVPEEHVRAALPFLSAQVVAMIQLQLATGARPGEVTGLRPCDVTFGTDGIWVFRPAEHKTEHFDRRRMIMLGPLAQEILRPWLDRDPDAYCFVPAEVVAARNARQRACRRSPMKPSHPAYRRKPNPERVPGRRYSANAYRVAIRRACVKAGVPIWSPLRLRHNAATAIRARFGLEAAQVIMGHAQADITEVYAEKDLALARRVAAEVG
jgi:integrase